MPTDGRLALAEVSEKVNVTLVGYFRSLGRNVDLTDDLDLISGTGATSDEGVDFAIDLQDALGVDVPHDFNPFVHPSGRRGMTFRELVGYAEGFVSATAGGQNGTY